MPEKQTQLLDSDFDRWDLFWSEYMVWSMRLACYSANQYFFSSIRMTLLQIFPSWLISLVLLGYSITCLQFIETAFGRRYNPAYENLQLSPSQRGYRVGRERLLYSCFVYSCVNLSLGLFITIQLSSQNRTVQAMVFEPIGFGFIGVVLSLFGVLFGIIFMTGRFGEGTKRIPLLYPFGLAGFLVPTLFVLNTIRSFLFTSGGGW